MTGNIGNRWILFLTDGAETVSGCNLVTEFEPPMLKQEFDEERRICEIGATPVFTGTAALEGSFSYIGYDMAWQLFLLKRKWVTLNAKYVVEDYTGAVETMKVLATIFFSEAPIIGKTTSAKLETNAVKFKCRAIRIVDVDPDTSAETIRFRYESHNGIHEIDGVDQTATLRSFLTVP